MVRRMKLPDPGFLRTVMLATAGCVAAAVGTAAMNHELAGTSPWWQSLACGVALAWAWTQSPFVRTLVTGLTVCLSMVLAFGMNGTAGVDVRACAQGASLGLLGAYALMAWLRWPVVHARLEEMCRAFDDPAGLEWLARHPPRTTPET